MARGPTGPPAVTMMNYSSLKSSDVLPHPQWVLKVSVCVCVSTCPLCGICAVCVYDGVSVCVTIFVSECMGGCVCVCLRVWRGMCVCVCMCLCVCVCVYMCVGFLRMCTKIYMCVCVCVCVCVLM